MRFYQYFGWILFTPLSIYLWSNKINLQSSFFINLLPIIWAYILPGVGTNYLKYWEFNIKGKIGRFKLQHGFVFGSATTLLFYLFLTFFENLGFSTFTNYVLVFLCLSFINIYYDYVAIKNNIIFVYNKPWSLGLDSWAITKDYAFTIFFGFFITYCPMVYFTILNQFTLSNNYFIFIIFELTLLLIPTMLFSLSSLFKYNNLGLIPCEKISENAKKLEDFLK